VTAYETWKERLSAFVKTWRKENPEHYVQRMLDGKEWERCQLDWHTRKDDAIQKWKTENPAPALTHQEQQDRDAINAALCQLQGGNK